MKVLSGNPFYYMRAIYEAGRPVCKEECIRLVYELYGIQHSVSTGKTVLHELLSCGHIRSSSRVANGKKRTFFEPAFPIEEFYKAQIEKFVADTFLGDYEALMIQINKTKPNEQE